MKKVVYIKRYEQYRRDQFQLFKSNIDLEFSRLLDRWKTVHAEQRGVFEFNIMMENAFSMIEEEKRIAERELEFSTSSGGRAVCAEAKANLEALRQHWMERMPIREVRQMMTEQLATEEEEEYAEKLAAFASELMDLKNRLTRLKREGILPSEAAAEYEDAQEMLVQLREHAKNRNAGLAGDDGKSTEMLMKRLHSFCDKLEVEEREREKAFLPEYLSLKDDVNRFISRIGDLPRNAVMEKIAEDAESFRHEVEAGEMECRRNSLTAFGLFSLRKPWAR